ncbi:copper-containing nitrite reductase [Parasalinivibrio latis]|uniref:copper-containing nitrite reductase n=1 Tax=Parasalinivibrio latis TaxID=2952610 RepID=UPI0030E236B7
MKKTDLIKQEEGTLERRNFLKVAATSLVAGGYLVAKGAQATSGGLEGFTVGTKTQAEELPRVKQKLVAPPFVPEHDQVAKGGPKLIEVELTVVEQEMEVADGVYMQAMTFNGSMPGPLIICHEGDYVELTLKNPATNTMVHNIDFHASTGALGGGELTNVAPGEQVKLRWKATKAGTFIYHCAPGGMMIPYHVVAGMNGAVMVLPRDGLKDQKGNPVKYDRCYYVGEMDLYLPSDGKGGYKRFGSPGEAMGETLEVMRTLTPSHIVFNGKVGALTGEHALQAKVGETVLFIHSQANRDSRIHIIGGHGDLVWHGGSFNDTPATNLETWPVFGGEASAALYTFLQPGIYAYVNHNLIEAIMLGAAGHISVSGEWNNDLMKQVQEPSPLG